MDEEEYRERNEIEGMFGLIKAKVGRYVTTYRKDMAMILALVKLLAWNMYVAYFLLLFPGSALACVFIIPISHTDF